MGGSPCIDGTRLRVADIVLLKRFEGLNANEISTYYARPLTVEQVEAALAFYESHRAEIDDYIEAEDALFEKFMGEETARGR